MQNTISERTTRQTLKQMGFSSRRPHRVPLLSAMNRTRRLQFTQDNQNWTIEDWKNVAWSDESRFLLRHSDCRVRIWRKEHESMDPSCLVSTVEAGCGGGGVMVWGIFSWHTLGPLIYIYIYAFSRRFYPKRLTVHSGYTFIDSVCVPWELNQQPFALLMQCSTTEPWEWEFNTNRALFKHHSLPEYCCWPCPSL